MGQRIFIKSKSECGKYTISVSFECFHKMLEIAKKYYPYEIGSSLVGHYSEDGFEAFIDDIAPLTRDSKIAIASFCRGSEGNASFFANLKDQYSGKKFYVGEWHSHPDIEAVASSLDDESQFAIAHDEKTNCQECILIILGGDFFCKPELGVFVYSRRSGKIKLLEVPNWKGMQNERR